VWLDTNFSATASVIVDVPRSKVWDALVKPEAIKQYMFGTDVTSDWREGSSITWKGEWEGKSYEDKGRILQLKPREVLQYTHFSALCGLPDRPESYHTVTIQLSDEGSRTHVTLTQDNNPTEQARAHSQENWEMMLAGLKRFVERHR
jgi:uncharacterized protein YndB with AHSA1/START domain